MNLDKTFLTSDHHFGHANIIKYTNRPFSSVEEMDAEMIKRWNETVGENDIVYHLGDFTLNDYGFAVQILSQLNGNIRFIVPTFHHDRRWITKEPPYYLFYGNGKSAAVCSALHVLRIDCNEDYPLSITLCHYPLEEWEASYHGGLHFHGHSHGNLSPKPGRIDIGVDVWDFRPFPLSHFIKVAETSKGITK